MENKKIKNATPLTYNNINFKSLTEVMVYKTLLQEGLNPQYEPYTYTIWQGFHPTIPFYTRNSAKDHIINMVKLQDITLTPDFYLEYKGFKIIIEAKGFENELFPYKFKMFRKLLESMEDKDKYLLFEIFTKKQLLEAITIIKNYGSNTKDENPTTKLAKKRSAIS